MNKVYTENINIKYVNKVYTENVNINLKNVENVEKLFLMEKNFKNLRLNEHSILQRCSVQHRMKNSSRLSPLVINKLEF